MKTLASAAVAAYLIGVHPTLVQTHEYSRKLTPAPLRTCRTHQEASNGINNLSPLER